MVCPTMAVGGLSARGVARFLTSTDASGIARHLLVSTMIDPMVQTGSGTKAMGDWNARSHWSEPDGV